MPPVGHIRRGFEKKGVNTSADVHIGRAVSSYARLPRNSKLSLPHFDRASKRRKFSGFLRKTAPSFPSNWHSYVPSDGLACRLAWRRTLETLV